MSQVKLCADSLGDLKGGIARLLIDREIEVAIADLADRALEDGKPRKVAITLQLQLKDGMVIADIAAQAKLPARASGMTEARPRVRGGKQELLFQTDVPENPDQPSVGDYEPGGRGNTPAS